MKLKTLLLLCLFALVLSACSKDDDPTLAGEIVAERINDIIQNNSVVYVECIMEERRYTYTIEKKYQLSIEGIFLYVLDDYYNLDKLIRYSSRYYSDGKALYLYFK